MTWWSRLTAAVTGAVLTLVVPVHAWAASNGVADVAIEAAKYRRRRSGFGFFGFSMLCCLLVVGAIVLIVVLIMRGRKRRR
ncbi:hypothetical protein KRMM14A1259_33390 [Krasilnikovia sp. MM14-A1259]